MIVEFYNKFPDNYTTQWNLFITEHSSSNIFYTKEMILVYESAAKHQPVIVIAKENDNIIGILVGVIQKEYEGILGFFSSRCIIFGCPIIKNDDANILSSIMNVFNKGIKYKAIYTQIRNFELRKLESTVLEKFGYVFNEHLNIHINLKQDFECFQKNMKSKLRQNIRKAEKKGLAFSIIEDINELKVGYNILKEVYVRAKLPLPDFSFFKNTYQLLGSINRAQFFKAVYENNIVGVRFVLTYKGYMYDWYAGSLQKYYKLNPNDYLPFKVIEWGFNNNEMNLFDFGGAGKPNIPYGVRDHKLKFSQELISPGRFQKIHHPLFYQFALLGFKFYKLMKK